MKIKTDSAQVARLVIAHEVAFQFAEGEDEEARFLDYLKKFKKAHKSISSDA